MKKIFTLVAIAATTLSTNAQTVSNSKLSDNWSIGIHAGVTTPTAKHAFFSNARPTVGLEIGREITPCFGLAAEGRVAINGGRYGFYQDPSMLTKTMIDYSNVSLLAKFNLTNLFRGYNGTPRCFEAVAVTGIGWGHYYAPGNNDNNTWSTKFGINLNFNVSQALQINVKPAIVYDMENGNGGFNKFNANKSSIELSAGVTYKFKNSNGTHNFTLAKGYDQAEVDGLNAKVNDLRGQMNAKDRLLDNNGQTIKSLQKQLNDFRNAGPKTNIITRNTNSMESVVTFGQGKSVIAASQLPNVERIATYMKNHKDSKVFIKGFASPEGSAAINAKIATARAEAVKTLLIQKYKIEASRIMAEGQGVGNMFSEPDWNRVSICTLDETK
ncbi:MAG: OmpA family protein [Bacteroidaceae bacterium]